MAQRLTAEAVERHNQRVAEIPVTDNYVSVPAGLRSESDLVNFWVPGLPAPKGSTKAFMPKGWNRPIITADNGPTQKAWASAVAFVASNLFKGAPTDGPIALEMIFHMPRPKSLPKRVIEHCKKPDIDKLARCLCDALTGIAFRDDSQIVKITAQKIYAIGQTGCDITVNRFR